MSRTWVWEEEGDKGESEVFSLSPWRSGAAVRCAGKTGKSRGDAQGFGWM